MTLDEVIQMYKDKGKQYGTTDIPALARTMTTDKIMQMLSPKSTSQITIPPPAQSTSSQNQAETGSISSSGGTGYSQPQQQQTTQLPNTTQATATDSATTKW